MTSNGARHTEEGRQDHNTKGARTLHIAMDGENICRKHRGRLEESHTELGKQISRFNPEFQ